MQMRCHERVPTTYRTTLKGASVLKMRLRARRVLSGDEMPERMSLVVVDIRICIGCDFPSLYCAQFRYRLEIPEIPTRSYASTVFPPLLRLILQIIYINDIYMIYTLI